MLTGDTRLACEAMLCLEVLHNQQNVVLLWQDILVSMRKKWSQVIAKHRNFLSLCPVDATSDPEMYKYKNDILVNLDGECSVASLNKRMEKILLRTEKICESSGADSGTTCREVKIYGFRINPQLTNSCKLLSSSKYTDYHLKYTCNNKFYEEEWQRGYALKEISQEIYNVLLISQREQGEKLTEISRYEFSKLPQNQRKQIGFKYYKINVAYYQKIAIKKECWINEK